MSELDWGSWVVIAVVLIGLIFVYVKRTNAYVMEIVDNGIVEAEKHFNSKEGKKKLAYATVKIKEKLPKILSILVTESMIIRLVEHSLNKLSAKFRLERRVELQGKSIINIQDINLHDKTVTLETHKILEDKDTELYANVQGKTDFKGRNEGRVEVGIKKKF